jgi:N-alpha-acetyltransferase 50
MIPTGLKLLKHLLETAKKDPSIIEVYLHVQTSNDDAKHFYLANGFEQTDIIKDYYKRIEPPDCFVLKMSLNEGHTVGPSHSHSALDTNTSVTSSSTK